MEKDGMWTNRRTVAKKTIMILAAFFVFAVSWSVRFEVEESGLTGNIFMQNAQAGGGGGGDDGEGGGSLSCARTKAVMTRARNGCGYYRCKRSPYYRYCSCKYDFPCQGKIYPTCRTRQCDPILAKQKRVLDDRKPTKRKS